MKSWFVLSTLLSGCSFAWSSGPPDGYRHMPYFDCTGTVGLPVADGFLALGGATGAIQAFRLSKAEYAARNDNQNRNVAGGFGVATAVLFGASAIYGLVQGHHCEEAKEELRTRIMNRPASMAPPPWPVAPAPAPPLTP